jgi:hypothetical protein
MRRRLGRRGVRGGAVPHGRERRAAGAVLVLAPSDLGRRLVVDTLRGLRRHPQSWGSGGWRRGKAMVGCFELPPRVDFRVTVVHVAGCWAVGVGSAVGSHGGGACPVLGVGVSGVGSHGEGGISAVGVVDAAWMVDGGLLALAWAKPGGKRRMQQWDRQSGSGAVVWGLQPPLELGRCRESSAEAVGLRWDCG